MAKNITNPDTLVGVHQDDEGTGIYWLIDKKHRVEQIFIPYITQNRAYQLAADFEQAGTQKLDAYRWVPERRASAQSLVSQLCGGNCNSDLDCIDSACRCIDGRCQRKSQSR